MLLLLIDVAPLYVGVLSLVLVLLYSFLCPSSANSLLLLVCVMFPGHIHLYLKYISSIQRKSYHLHSAYNNIRFCFSAEQGAKLYWNYSHIVCFDFSVLFPSRIPFDAINCFHSDLEMKAAAQFKAARQEINKYIISIIHRS